MFYFGPINHRQGQDIKGKQVHAHIFVLYLRPSTLLYLSWWCSDQHYWITEGGSWVRYLARIQGCCVVCMISLCLRGFSPGCFGFLPHSPTCKVFIGYSKLPIGAHDCLSLCQPVCPLFTLPSPTDGDIGSCDPA